jgi:hypothetical protein
MPRIKTYNKSELPPFMQKAVDLAVERHEEYEAVAKSDLFEFHVDPICSLYYDHKAKEVKHIYDKKEAIEAAGDEETYNFYYKVFKWYVENHKYNLDDQVMMVQLNR